MNICGMCDRPALDVFEEDDLDPDVIQPAGGLHLIVYAGYGMFIDMPEYATHQQRIDIRLCHDCCIKFVDMFPKRFQASFKVAHSKDICLANSPVAKHPSQRKGCKYSY